MYRDKGIHCTTPDAIDFFKRPMRVEATPLWLIGIIETEQPIFWHDDRNLVVCDGETVLSLAASMRADFAECDSAEAAIKLLDNYYTMAFSETADPCLRAFFEVRATVGASLN